MGSSTEDKFPDDHQRASGMLDLGAQTEDEVNQMRTAMFEREGLVLSLFQMLRVIPRRVLMLFKMNDLIRWAFVFETRTKLATLCFFSLLMFSLITL